MKGEGFLLFGLILVIAARLSEYASKARPGDPPQWLSAWASTNRSGIALSVLILSMIVPVNDMFQRRFARRHAARPFLQRTLDEYASRYFPKQSERKNRLTIFKETSGWTAMLYGFVGLRAFRSRATFRRICALRPGRKYLGVYVRSSEARNKKSFTMLRISDASDGCEGMAGHVWENGSCCVVDLPALTQVEVGKVARLSDLAPGHPVRVYAESTNLGRDEKLIALKAVRFPARHFIGELIRRPDGQRWGVLLLDSEDPDCPVLPGSSTPADHWLKECATFAGKLVT